jgi:hypothetical protein
MMSTIVDNSDLAYRLVADFATFGIKMVLSSNRPVQTGRGWIGNQT